MYDQETKRLLCMNCSHDVVADERKPENNQNFSIFLEALKPIFDILERIKDVAVNEFVFSF